MRRLAIAGFVATLLPMRAVAICIVEPLEPQLRAADIVYVGTVVRSELASSLEILRQGGNPRKARAVVRHTLIPEIVLKGDAPGTSIVLSTWQYNDPKSEISSNVAERLALMPGDTLLVVAQSGEPTWFGLCTPTREWNAEAAKVVHAVFQSGR